MDGVAHTREPGPAKGKRARGSSAAGAGMGSSGDSWMVGVVAALEVRLESEDLHDRRAHVDELGGSSGAIRQRF